MFFFSYFSPSLCWCSSPLLFPSLYSYTFPLVGSFLKVLADSDLGCPEYIRSCMEDCWAESPEQRPDFPTIRDRLRKMREGMWVSTFLLTSLPLVFLSATSTFKADTFPLSAYLSLAMFFFSPISRAISSLLLYPGVWFDFFSFVIRRRRFVNVQEAVYYGPVDGNDGDLCQQSRSFGERAHTTAVRGEAKDRGPPSSHATQVSIFHFNFWFLLKRR